MFKIKLTSCLKLSKILGSKSFARWLVSLALQIALALEIVLEIELALALVLEIDQALALVLEIDHYHFTASPHYCISQSFNCLPTTTSVSHLTCPLPLHHCITTSLHYHVTVLVSHLTCPLPPHQPVIWHTLYHCITFKTFQLSLAP